MPDLKPCPFCGGEASMEKDPVVPVPPLPACCVCCVSRPTVEDWNTRPALELPEGYREDRDEYEESLHHDDLLAYIDEHGIHVPRSTSPKHYPVIGIWLQRRSK